MKILRWKWNLFLIFCVLMASVFSYANQSADAPYDSRHWHCFMSMTSNKWMIVTGKGYVSVKFDDDKTVMSMTVSKGDLGSVEECQKAIPGASKKYKKATMYCKGSFLFGDLTITSDKTKEHLYKVYEPQCKTLQ